MVALRCRGEVEAYYEACSRLEAAASVVQVRASPRGAPCEHAAGVPRLHSRRGCSTTSAWMHAADVLRRRSRPCVSRVPHGALAPCTQDTVVGTKPFQTNATQAGRIVQYANPKSDLTELAVVLGEGSPLGETATARGALRYAEAIIMIEV